MEPFKTKKKCILHQKYVSKLLKFYFSRVVFLQVTFPTHSSFSNQKTLTEEPNEKVVDKLQQFLSFRYIHFLGKENSH